MTRSKTHALLIAVAAAAPACQSPPEVKAFDESFRFGSATAGFQVEAGCPTLPAELCEDRASDWYQWVTDPELVADGSLFLSGDPMEMAPGHYELYEEDLQRASEELGQSVYRFSFEWSRLFPDGAAEQATSVEELYSYVDEAQLAWYHDYVDAMATRGLEPMATVNHYTLPLWVHDGKACNLDLSTCSADGWVNGERIIPLIALFSGFVAQEFGQDIDLWLTLNEPLAVILSGYVFPSEDRTNPPGVSDMATGLEVAFNMAKGHAAMAQAIKERDPVAEVGVVANLGVAFPDDPNDPEDVEGAEHLDYIYNQLMLDAFLNGRMDWDLDGEVDHTEPGMTGHTDFLGLNYYFAFRVAGFRDPLPGFAGYPSMDFFPLELDTSPERIGEAIDLTARWGLPIWITENGVANPGPDSGQDFLVPALAAIQERAEAGVDLRGYLYWSLVDNYEWNHGMGMRFGLYEVDDVTKERSLRPIGETYRDIVALHGLPIDPQ